jgi:hypothetical protein
MWSRELIGNHTVALSLYGAKIYTTNATSLPPSNTTLESTGGRGFHRPQVVMTVLHQAGVNQSTPKELDGMITGTGGALHALSSCSER